MIEKIIIVIIGFFLTTVCGGLLGRYFQQRTWKNQWIVNQNDRIIQVSISIFEEISKLMDKRLYRMRRLFWGIEEKVSKDEIENRVSEYHSVLYEWNDSINRNLALLQFYFGNDMRNSLDYDVGKKFVNTGAKLTLLYKKALSDESVGDLKSCEQDLSGLGNKVYDFNLKLLNCIKDRSNNLPSINSIHQTGTNTS